MGGCAAAVRRLVPSGYVAFIVAVGGGVQGLLGLGVLQAAPVAGRPSLMAEQPTESAPGFRRDVMPVFFRAGCNSGNCHGSARGKDGFMLSLFGYDPKGDYQRIVTDIPGRRVNTAAPEESLLLLKAINAVPHSGGKLFDKGSVLYQTLSDWITAGAADDTTTPPEAVGIRFPKESVVFRVIGGQGVARVKASFDDGSEQDVTHLARFFSNDESVATIDANGTVTAVGPGDTHVFARYGRFTVGAEVIVLTDDADFTWSEPRINNFIDTAVFARLRHLRILPSETCDDETFLRRVTIDLAGRIPTPGEFEAFVTDPDRAAKIDELIDSDSFSDLWATLWGESLRLIGGEFTPEATDFKAAESFRAWIHQQIRNDRPLNEFVSEMTRASGANLTGGPVNLFTMLAQGEAFTPKQFAAEYAQAFLGIQVQCAECHNHPFDRWTMDDYYGFVSCFTKLKRKRGADLREWVFYSDLSAGPAAHLIDQRPVPARPLGAASSVADGIDPRVALSEWIGSPDNRLFARNMANRIWAHLLGRGVIDPVDDVRVSNPPSNGPLLNALADRLIKSGFSLRALVRDICNSNVYQLSSRTNPSNERDRRHFSHALYRRLRADVLLDALHDIAGTVVDLPGFPPGTRAIHHYPRMPRGPTSRPFGDLEFFVKFGRANRGSVCACDTKTEPTLVQALSLINLTDNVRDPRSAGGVVKKLVDSKAAPSQIIDALYVRCLCRHPSREEMTAWQKWGGTKPPDPSMYEDVFWSLVNSSEFLFNH